MKKFLRRLFTACAILAVASSVAFAAAGWDADYEKAVARAKEEKKMVLLDFTGSDWCPPCVALKKEVFSQPEFQEYAKTHLVLVELDFSPFGQPVSKEFRDVHQKLMEAHRVEQFPTIIVLDSEGRKIGQLSYQPGGPKAFISALEKLKK